MTARGNRVGIVTPAVQGERAWPSNSTLTPFTEALTAWTFFDEWTSER
jgi:hypothetical protein